MSENPGECAYQHCVKPQSEHTYYLCEEHYQQAWEKVLSKPPLKGRKRKRERERKSEYKPYVCSRGHYVDPANHTAIIKKAWMECRACNRTRATANRKQITDPDELQALSDESYRKILAQIGKGKNERARIACAGHDFECG